jgi:hypothetical protein
MRKVRRGRHRKDGPRHRSGDRRLCDALSPTGVLVATFHGS